MLLAFSLVAGLRYTGAKVAVTREQSTDHGMSKVLQQSIHGFVAAHNRLPCPADGSLGSSDPNYGTEAAALCLATPANAGIVPWKALGLQKTDALDAWGSRIGYAVTAALAAGTPYSAAVTTGTDAINVQSCTGTTHTCGSQTAYAYVLISYGVDQIGSWLNCDGTGQICSRRTQPALVANNPEYYNGQAAAFASSAPPANAFSVYPYSTAKNVTQQYGNTLVYETSVQLCAALNGKKTGSSAPYCTNPTKPLTPQPTQPQVASGAPPVAFQNTDALAVAANPAVSGISNAYGCGSGSNYCPGSSNAGSLSNTLSYVNSGNGTVYNPGGNCASLVGNLGFACVYDPLWSQGITIGNVYGQGGGGGDWVGPIPTSATGNGDCFQCFGRTYTQYLVPYQSLTYLYGSSYQSFAFAAYLVDGGMPVQVDAYSSNVCTVSGDVAVGSNQINNIGPTSLVANATLSGAGIPAGTTITSLNGNSGNINISQKATVKQDGVPLTATLVLNVTGNVTNVNNGTLTLATITGLSSTQGVAVSQVISGPGIPSGTSIVRINGTTLTLSQAATATSNAAALTITGSSSTFTGDLNNNSVVQNITPSCVPTVGQLIEGWSTLPSGTTITAVNGSTLTVSANAISSQLGQVLAVFDNAVNITGKLTAGSTSVTGIASTNGVQVGLLGLALGQSISGSGIPPGAYVIGISGTTLTISLPATLSVQTAPLLVTPWVRTGTMIVSNDNANNINHSVPVTGTWTATSAPPAQFTKVSSNLGLAVGQAVSGFGIQPGTTITGISSTMTLAPAPTVTQAGQLLTILQGSLSFLGTPNNSTTISGITSTAGLTIGQSISGSGIPAGTTISTVGANSITLSNTASGTTAVTYSVTPGVLTVLGTLSKGSNIVTAVSCTTALSVGQAIAGPGVPSGTTITAITPTTLTLSQDASSNQAAIPLAVGPGIFGVIGSITNGVAAINNPSSTLGLTAGSAVAGPGLPVGTLIQSPVTSPIPLSQPAQATVPSAFLFVSQAVFPITGTIASGSNQVTNLSTTAGLAVGEAIIDPQGFIPAGTSIISINYAQASLSLSSNATTSATGETLSVVQGIINLTGTISSGSSIITNPSFTTGVVAGALITGTGIPSGTVVTSVTGSSIGLSQAATASMTGAILSLTQGILAATADLSSGHGTTNNAVVPPGTAVGNTITGPGLQSGTTISNINIQISLSKAPTIATTGTLYAASVNLPPTPFTGDVSAGSTTVMNISSSSGLTVGQTIAGAGIAAGTTIAALTPTAASLTLSQNANNTVNNAALTVTQGSVGVTGSLTSGSPTITGVSSIAGLAAGDAITGTGIPAGTTITNIGSTTATMSQNATATSSSPVSLTVTQTLSLTGTLTAGSGTVTNPSMTFGLTTGNTITGPGTAIPVGTTITAIGGSTLTLSQGATAQQTAANLFVTDRKPVTDITGSFTANSTSVTGLSSTAGLYIGASITGPGIKGGTTIANIVGTTLTLSQTTSAAGTNSPLYFSGWITGITGTFTGGSPVVTNVSPTTNLAVGQVVIAPGLSTGAAITAIFGSTLTLSSPAAVGGTGQLIAVTSPATGPATFTGVVTTGLNTITNPQSNPAALPSLGQTITGKGLNSGTLVTASSSGTLTVSSQATTSSTSSGESLYATYPACPGPATSQGGTTPGGLYQGTVAPYPNAGYPPPAAPIPQHPTAATAATILSQIWPQPQTPNAGITSVNSSANGLSGNYIDQRDNQFTNRQFVDSNGNPQIFNVLVFQTLPYIYATGNGANCAGGVSPTGACPFGNGLTYSYGLLFEGAKGCFTDTNTADCTFDPRADEWANPPVSVTMDCGQRP